MNLGAANHEWKNREPLSAIRATSYMPYSFNYGTNAIEVQFGHLKLYFSYGKIVAFRYQGDRPVVVRNVFSMTTGKHLNVIDGGSYESRLDVDEFAEALSTALLYFGG